MSSPTSLFPQGVVLTEEMLRHGLASCRTTVANGRM